MTWLKINVMNANLSALAQRSQALRPTTYHLIGGLGLIYVLLLLLTPLMTAGDGGVLVVAWKSLRDGSSVAVQLAFIAAVITAFLFSSALSGVLAALLGLALFVVVWTPETLRWGVRSAALVPFCAFFLFRASNHAPRAAVLVAATSMITMYLALVDKRVEFPGMPLTILHVMLWVWLSFVGVSVVNLLLAWWSDSNPPKHKVMVSAGTLKAAITVAPVTPLSHAERVEKGAALRKKNQPVYQYRAVTPSHDLFEVVGMSEVKDRILEAGREALKTSAAQSNGILLYGPPGNGKTYLAEALAGSLGIPIIHYDFGKAASKYVNQTTENAIQVFSDAVAQAPCILFIDEVEAILSERSQSGLGAGEYPKTVSALLTQLVDVRKRGVIVVAATNHIELMDSAAAREGRFDTKIEIPHPDAPARKHLISKSFCDAVLATVTLSPDVIDSLTLHWDGFSVSRICAVVGLVGRRIYTIKSTSQPSVAEFQKALREVQGSYGDIVLTNITGLDQLHFDGVVSDKLSEMAASMRNTFEFERLGGRLIGGALFYGPPGTGKTIAASAIAKSAGWAMISTNGTDLAREPEKIKQVISRAVGLKPCIVFIDEADALISDRSQNWNSMATNAFLSQTGDDRASLRDVLFIAATNHPEGADSAMVRGGRFGEHIEFTLPVEATILAYLRAEAAKSPVVCADTVLSQCSSSMVGIPLSDVRGSLKRACNRAASRAMKQCTADMIVKKATLTLEDFLI